MSFIVQKVLKLHQEINLSKTAILSQILCVKTIIEFLGVTNAVLTWQHCKVPAMLAVPTPDRGTG